MAKPTSLVELWSGKFESTLVCHIERNSGCCSKGATILVVFLFRAALNIERVGSFR